MVLPGALVSVARTLLRCISSSCSQFERHRSFVRSYWYRRHVPKYIVPRPTYVLMWRVRDLDDYSFVNVRPMVNCTSAYPWQYWRVTGTADDSMSSNFAMNGSIKQTVKQWFGSDLSPTLPLLSSHSGGGCRIRFALTPVWILRWCSSRWYAVKSSPRWDAFILAWDALFKWHALHCSPGRLKRRRWWQCWQGAKCLARDRAVQSL